jgi:hypothetical protein
VLAVALAVDAATAVVRALPVVVDAKGAVGLGRVDLRTLAGLLLPAGYLVAALGLSASLAGRDRMVFRCAVGEECTGAAEQAVSRDPPRRFSPGPFPLKIVIDDVPGAVPGRPGGAGGGIRLRDERGATVRAGRWSPLWYGWGRFVRPVGSGDVLRYEVRAERGATLESAFVKLDLARGAGDSIAPEKIPHRVYVRVEPADAGGARVRTAVFRGKLQVAQGPLAVGEPLAFEGLELRFAEWRPWVELEMLRDPGLPLAGIGAALALAGWALALRRRA